MDAIGVVSFSFSIFGLIGFVYATTATKKLKDLEESIAELKRKIG